MKQVVRIEKDEPISGRMLDGDVPARTGSFRASVSLEALDPRVLLSIRLYESPAFIGAAIVHDDPLPILVGLSEDALRCFADDVRPIE